MIWKILIFSHFLVDDLDLESFGEKKKKKKKKKPLDMEELEEALPGDDKAEVRY